MADRFDTLLAFVLKEEGGFAQLKGDETTNLGVKKSTWEAYVKHPVTVADIRRLTVADVTPLYRTQYFDPLAKSLFEPLDLVAFDLSVNSGVGRATSLLASVVPGKHRDRRALIIAANAVKDKEQLVEKYINARVSFLKSLKSFQYFGRGWLARVERVRAYAKRFVEQQH